MSDTEKLVNNTQPTSLQMMKFLGKETKNKVGNEEYYSNIQLQEKPGQPSSATIFSNITATYTKQKNENNIGALVLKGGHELVNGSIALGVMMAPESVGSSFILSGVALVADKGLSQLENMFAEEARKQIRQNLKTQLDKYLENTSNEQYHALLQVGDPEAFRQELVQRTEPILGLALDAIPSEDQDIVNRFFNKELANLIKDGFSALNDVQVLQDDEINKNRKDIISLSQTFVKYAKRNQNQLDGLAVSQKEINDGLIALNNRVGQTEEGIEFIQQYMFGNMPPEEQLASLRSNMFPDMPADQRNDLEEKIGLVQRRQEIMTSVSGYLNGANEVINIAQTLGVSSELLSKASSIVNIGAQAFNAFASFASGNYLACIGSIVGIFGGGGRDIAGERHKEIMNALEQLYDGIKEVDQEIRNLDKKLDIVIDNQKVIFDAIKDLSKQVQQNFEQVFEELHRIEIKLDSIRELIRGTIEGEYNNCQDLIIDPASGKRRIDTARSIYPTYADITSLFRDFGSSLSACDNIMQNTRTSTKTFNPIFLMRNYSQPLNRNVDIENYLTNNYQPALDLYRSRFGTVDLIAAKQVNSLMCPVDTVDALNKKFSGMPLVLLPRFEIDNDSLLDEIMTDLIAPSTVIMHDSKILDTHFYYPFFSPTNDRLLTYDELLNSTDIRRTGYYALFKALTLTDIAIAQQAMLSGDILLPTLHSVYSKQFSSPTDTDKQLFEKMKLLISNNDVIAQNFILYCFYTEVTNKSNFINYSIALGSLDSTLLKNCTVSPWEFKYGEKGWTVKIGENNYALPNAQTLADGKLIYQNDLYTLVALRTRLNEEIAGYDLLNNLTQQKRIAYNEFVLNNV